MRIPFLLALAACLLVPSPSTAEKAAAEQPTAEQPAAERPVDATAFLKARHAEVLKILRQKDSKPGAPSAHEKALTAKLGNLLDYDALAQRALKDHWQDLTPAQRTEFTGLLSQLVERNYQENLESTMEYKVVYTSAQPRGSEVLVQTQVRSTKNRRAPEVMIDYTLLPSANAYRVCDITTDGVSLVANYRAQFNRIIRKDGWSGLIERMKKKLVEQG